MKKIEFNNDWYYFRPEDDTHKQPVTLPHDAMIFERRTMRSKGGKNIGWFEANDYIYEKKFSVPHVYNQQKVIFEFEGVYQQAKVFINGQLAMYRPYGYTNFYVEANHFVNLDQKNIIKVIVENSQQPNSRWYSGTGIYRPVSMYLLPDKHIFINGIKIKTIDPYNKTISVTVHTNSPGALVISILDQHNLIIKKRIQTEGLITTQLTLDNAELWDLDHPKLYQCQVAFGEDIQGTTFGVRTISVSAETGLLLNGKRTILYGACIHHDHGLLGAVSHPYAEYRRVRLLKEAGYNAIRSAHNPCSKSLLDACDQLGMLVLDEYVDMWYIHKTKHDYASYVLQWWKEDLKDMVDKDYNHPSVIMYSIGNEVSETAQMRGIELVKQMTDYLHTLDNRPVTCGVNIFFNYLSQLGFGIYTDKKAEKASINNKHNAVGSEFFNRLASKLGDKVMKFGASLKGSDKHTKKAFANMDVAGYNYGILRYKKDLKKHPKRVILGTETFCKDTCLFFDYAKHNTSIIGDFVWAGQDYLGEVGIGSWVYEDQVPDFSYGPGWMTAGSGRLDILGNTGGETLFTKVAFEQILIGLAVVPVFSKKKKHSASAWKMSNAIESWSFEGSEGKIAHVEVYSKAAYVSLFLNQERIASNYNKKYGGVFYFKVSYQPGTLVAVSYDKEGTEIARTSLVTAQHETTLSIQPESLKVIPQDLIYAHVKVTDKQGIVKPLVNSTITVRVEHGELIGLGNACPYNEQGYKTHTNVTYEGEALAIVKPHGKDEVTIEVQSDFGITKSIIQVN